MSTADSILRRVALVLSIVLVILLATIATISVFGAADDEPEAADGEVSPLDEEEDPADPASATALYPATGIQVRSDGSAMTISCAPVIGNSSEYLISAENLGDLNQTFLVAVDLVGRDGQRVEAVAEVDELLPGEERQVTLTPRGDIGAIEECEITAVQRDRQVILTGR